MVWMLVFLSATIQISMPVVAQGGFITPKVISSSGINQCPLQEESKVTLEEITNEVRNILSYSVPNQCGDGLWYRVAYLNMSDPSQQCPSAWREYTSDGIRVCARPNLTEGSCPGTLYPVRRQYSKVCGRVTGYQFGSPSAFEMAVVNSLTINEAYLDGVSITHGSPRNHIWSYAAGASERNRPGCFHINCPCSGGRDPPSFVGNNYYCESAYDGITNCYVVNTFLPNDPLWDGQQCDNEGTCCTGTNTPPWFNMELPDSTTDDIEVRICHDQNTNDEDSPIKLLELYVQ